jgi:hypothetical protein
MNFRFATLPDEAQVSRFQARSTATLLSVTSTLHKKVGTIGNQIFSFFADACTMDHSKSKRTN